MILGRVITFSAERYPNKEAVVDGTRRYTYGQWIERINRLANAFLGIGIRKGDRVVMLLKNREETAAAHWALQKIGAVSTPVNWRYGPAEVEYIITDAGAAAVIYEEASRAAVEQARPSFPSIPLIFVGTPVPPDSFGLEDLIAGAPEHEPRVDVTEGDYSIMLYTSGTTGRPKGVPRTHKNEYSAAMAHVIQSRNSLFDRTLGVMPFYHTMGVRSMLAMALVNGCLVIQNDWDPGQALELLERERINSLYLVPTLYHDLVNHEDFEKRDLSRLKKLGYAGAPMSGTLTRRLAESLKPEVFVNHLGSTEIYTFTICDRVIDKPTCAGRPGIHGRVRIVRADPERRARPDEVVPRGQVGELIVSLESDEAFSGYWNRPDADAKAIKDGWYFTGDLVYEDEEGDIYVVGRVDDMIISGGENIHPVEVEEVLLRHPGVLEVAVIGLPHDRWGQQVTAFVVPRDPNLTAEELDQFCRDAPDLANFKRPRQYFFVKALPKTPTGKLLRRKLAEGEYELSQDIRETGVAGD